MLAAAQGRILGPHVHLEVLEEVLVFVRGEGDEHADRAAHGGVHETLGTALDQRGFL